MKLKEKITGIRKNKFIELLENNNIFFDILDYSIVCEITPTNYFTYFPKSDKLQIHKSNQWILLGYDYIQKLIEENKKI